MNAEPKFTPGPWSYQRNHNMPRYGCIIAVNGKTICDARFAEGAKSAHLIAAAPELYEALRSIPVDNAHQSDWDDWRASVDAALAKAEGKA
jgi:hypothetical protein